ncbi:hypothetical protein AX14_009636 [Amanita brunnescens Koide BX004]|nr:hypothetical protein AX14_009636 [Amanita brunnescens Koide BX004]
MSSLPTPKSVLIIGGGPCGLVTLRNLIEHGDFERVELVERRDNIGGVWYQDEDRHPSGGEPRQQGFVKPRWRSPAYPGLVGNVLPQFLSYSGFPFPERTKEHPHQPFPTLMETYEYLRSFADPFIKKGNIRLNWEVVKVEEEEDDKTEGGWKVHLRNWNEDANGMECIETWDAVVVAVGWYDNPVWPDTDGIDVIKAKGCAIHARDWRGAEEYENKRVLVVANAASSNDIAAYLAPVSRGPVYQSIRRPAFPGFPSLPDDRIKMVSPVSKYTLQETTDGRTVVEAALNDGTVISDIDIVIFGTGYRPYPSFIHVLNRNEDGTNQRMPAPLASLSIKPYRVPSIHRYILYAYNPTLAFVGLPMSFTPFTVADVTSIWLALAWSRPDPNNPPIYPEAPPDRLQFEQERVKAVQEWLSSTENPTCFLSYNVLAFGEQSYAAGLRKDVVDRRPELDIVLPVWSDEKTKEREAMYPLRLQALQYKRDHVTLGN